MDNTPKKQENAAHHKSTEVVQFKAGDYIFKQGDPCLEIYIIQSGKVEIQQTGLKNEIVTLGSVSQTEFLGEIAFLLERRHASSAKVISDVKAIKITKESLNLQIKEIPSWVLSLTKGLAIKLEKLNENIRKHSSHPSS